MILHINTKDQRQVSVSLKNGDKVVRSLSEENQYGSQVLLPLIEKLLTSKGRGAKLNHPPGGLWRQLEGIEVETGPGSFTGLKVGVSVANALGFALGIPVNGKKMEVELKY